MKHLNIFWLLLLPNLIFSQTIISGVVSDTKGLSIIGANIMIDGTYDGSITDENGAFQFETFEEGDVVLLISYLGYETKKINAAVSTLNELQIELRESVTTLDAVEVSASTFKAGDNSKMAALKPLDIVTTAGSMGDVIAAMRTLPGAQSNAEDGRLFIRGGDARETNIYIDGLKVFSPYTRTIGGTPSRGRYSPFLFQGVSFSTGGYSAAFGQALSGILDMNTIDEPDETATELSLMTVGAGVGHTQKWDRQSISFSGSYIDLAPYNWAAPSKADWITPYRGVSGEAVYRYKTKNGLLKSYLASETSGFKLARNTIDDLQQEVIDIQNKDLYGNTSYNAIISPKTSVFTGLSIGHNVDHLKIDEQINMQRQLDGVHARLALKTIMTERFILNYGVDYLFEKHGRKIIPNPTQFLTNNLYSTFFETDYYFSKNLALKTGVRAEYSALRRQTTIDPRVTIAQKLSKNSQLSLGYGRFTQEVDPELLFYNDQLVPERSSHYLLNFNHKSEKQMFRAEAFYKDYENLLQYKRSESGYSEASNEGNGRVYGIDLFWRANQLFENFDFWVSYSWLNHQRIHRDFPVKATPRYSPAHNLSVVSKIWIPDLRSQLGFTFNMASGRPFENPNTPGFLNERSGLFKSINLSWAYLISQQKILFVSVSNLTGFKNDFGYEYGSARNENGLYPGRLIRPNDDRFFFAGFFWTISRNKSKNQLNNL